MSRRTALRWGLAADASLALPSVLSACNSEARPASGSARTLRIGYVSPKSGPLAAFGEADDFILQGISEHVSGGFDVGGRSHPIEVVVRDSASEPDVAAQMADELITDEQIDLMVTASTPETTNPVADRCEHHGVPCISTVAPWQPWFFGRDGDPSTGFTWTYHFFWGMEDIIAVFLDIWRLFPTNNQVGVLWPDDADGRAWADAENGFPLSWTRADSTSWTPAATATSQPTSPSRSSTSAVSRWRS